MARTGRRPGSPATREEILSSALACFAERGYDVTTIRDIAGKAGVDPRLVLHYFGSKEGLFDAAVRAPFDPSESLPGLLAAGLDGLGARLVEFLVETWDSPAGKPAVALFRSALSSDRAAELLRDFVQREILSRIALEVPHPDGEVRASLAATQICGLAFVRYVVKLPPIASAPPSVLAVWIGPTLQRYFELPR